MIIFNNYDCNYLDINGIYIIDNNLTTYMDVGEWYDWSCRRCIVYNNNEHSCDPISNKIGCPDVLTKMGYERYLNTNVILSYKMTLYESIYLRHMNLSDLNGWDGGSVI